MLKKIRPRLTKEEYEWLKSKKESNKNFYKLLIISDLHIAYLDYAAMQSVINLIEDNYFDEIIFNGDVFDFPYLSKYHKRLYDDTLSEAEEIEEFKIIASKIKDRTKAKLIFREGNHEERLTNPYILSKEQLTRVANVYKYYKTDTLKGILSSVIDEYDPYPERFYYNIFYVIHGLSIAKNAATKNLYTYMASGTSGHSHRLNSTYIANKKHNYVWIESGCLRTIENVEYLPTASVADWMQGFVIVTFYLGERKPMFFANTYSIVKGKCYYNNVIY